jgi:hypothetical protein
MQKRDELFIARMVRIIDELENKKSMHIQGFLGKLCTQFLLIRITKQFTNDSVNGLILEFLKPHTGPKSYQQDLHV